MKVCHVISMPTMADMGIFNDLKLKLPNEKEFELHKYHDDIFFCLDGELKIQILLSGFLEESYNEEKDFAIIKPTGESVIDEIILKKGEAYRVGKNVPHKPNLCTNDCTIATSGIIKERIN